jgi:Arc/MetJ-type ribon-helix-helix transcriptional regulator
MRNPSRTVRVDLQTHQQLQDLAERYSVQWGLHVSIADVVRMGLTLILADIERREDGEGSSP